MSAALYRWKHKPTVRCLLFAGILVVLAANFIVGGSRIGEALALTGMNAVPAYGFFGQVLWMFGGIAVLMFFGATAAVRSLGPEMAGASAQGLIAFVFAMPLLVHPIVFFMFGRAMENDGEIPRFAIYLLALFGIVGVALSLMFW